MTDSSIFDDMDKPRKKYCTCSKKKKEKQTILWTVYHSVLVIELFILIIIEGVELLGWVY